MPVARRILSADIRLHGEPENDQRTDAEWQEKRTALHRKIDRNIDRPEEAKAQVEDDPEFAAWLVENLRKK